MEVAQDLELNEESEGIILDNEENLSDAENPPDAKQQLREKIQNANQD
jgi:hypothetical protein